MLRKLAVMAGWVGAAFVVHMSFAMSSLDYPTTLLAATYALALATTFALHRATRGPPMFAVAFGLVWALFVEGLAVVFLPDASPGRRGVLAVLLALPLVALVVRRFSIDPEDAWFSRTARRIVPLALVLALPMLVAAAVGRHAYDPAPYDRARRVLGHESFGADLVALVGIRDESPARRFEHERHWAAVSAAPSGVDPAVRGEVVGTCSRFAADDPSRACACAHELLVAGSHTARERRRLFFDLALLSALPFGVALLFAWRGRREREKAG